MICKNYSETPVYDNIRIYFREWYVLADYLNNIHL